MLLHSKSTANGAEARLWCGDAVEMLQTIADGAVDLVVTSPPYFIGKEYDRSSSARDFTAEIARITPDLFRVLKPGGSLCWQVGNHVQNGRLTPLDFLVAAEMENVEQLTLRNRIVWTFGHGVHSASRFSGRHETILWYTKGNDYYFDLDSARIPQIYPGKRHYKGPKKGDWSGNPLGKNPGDVWDIGDLWSIPNVKANHIEKTQHPCQFPSALVRRLIVALSPQGGLVTDPYCGSGTSAVASLLESRNFEGGDIEPKYVEIATKRVSALIDGSLRIRADVGVKKPSGRERVATAPPHFRATVEAANG